jgi:DNA-binding beta-propeller fold protein YncE
MKRILSNLLLALLLVSALNYTAHPDRVNLHDLILSYPGLPYLSPSSLAASPDGKRLYIACATANQVAVYDVAQREIVRRIDVPPTPSGLTLSSDGESLFVTCAAPKSKVCIIATASGKLVSVLSSGHTAMAPVLSRDAGLLYVCNRFNDSVEIFDLQSRRALAQIRVDREPVAAALSPDGALLFIANHINSGHSDHGIAAATVSVIDTANRKLLKDIPLTNGSTLLRGVCVSPDGKYVVITHVLARFHPPTASVVHAWMNDNALSLIDVSSLKLLTTVLLDDDGRGAANPWAVNWSPDGKFICVTHAGTHEVSLIDAPALLAKINALPERLDSPPKSNDSNAARIRGDVPNDFGFLSGLRTRVKLHTKGPRCSALVGNKLFVGNYFSDSLSILDVARDSRSSATIQLESPLEIVPSRKGEMYFNDATICFQGWQSCASCHSSDARVDGMNRELLNDGLRNPRNVKSLLFCFQTQPVMSKGVRSDAATAIRAGILQILFTQPREQVASAIDEFIKTLQPLPSPYLVHNRLSPSAKRGRSLFFSDSVGCAKCHAPPFFTDLKSHAVGTDGVDQRTEELFTPTLIEVWRTAPYLHDGSAVTLRDAVLTHYAENRRWQTSRLGPQQLDDLVAYLQAL